MALAAAMLTPACGNNAGKETKAEVQESAAVQANVTHLTKADFLAKVYNYEKNPKEWKYEGDKPAIVDFYATWCGPCKAIAPVLEKLAAEYKGKIVVYKIDTDKEPELSAAFGIRSIPTLLFIPAKGTPQVAQGALPEEALRKTIDEFYWERNKLLRRKNEEGLKLLEFQALIVYFYLRLLSSINSRIVWFNSFSFSSCSSVRCILHRQ